MRLPESGHSCIPQQFRAINDLTVGLRPPAGSSLYVGALQFAIQNRRNEQTNQRSEA